MFSLLLRACFSRVGFIFFAWLLVMPLLAHPRPAVADGGDASLIHACVQQGSQQVRIIGPDESCRRTETPVHWPGVPSSPPVSSQPLAVTVNCAAGETVADALARGPETTSRLTVTIVGVCQEAVVVARDAITLQGASPGDGLAAPAEASTVLTVLGQRINLNQLTLTGGSSGLAATRGASFTATNLHVRGATDAGVFMLFNASGRLTNSLIEDGGKNGIAVQLGASVGVVGGTIQNNALIGIQVSAGGHATVSGAVIRDNAFRGGMPGRGGSLFLQNVTIEGSDNGLQSEPGGSVTLTGSGAVSRNNRSAGILGSGGAVQVLGGARVSGNGFNGIDMIGGTLSLHDGAIVENNTQRGISLAAGSATFGGGGSAGPIIRNNSNDGIHLRDVSVARFFSAGNPAENTQVTGNGSFGIFCEPSPAVALMAGFVTVSGNAAGQVSCPVALEP